MTNKTISPNPSKTTSIPISTPKQVQQYYQQQEVAQRYIRKRFTEPLNVVEHQRQAALLNRIIRKQQCRNVLEFAPGPARLTIELDAQNGTSIDSSESMLSLARERMRAARKRWNFIQGNILTLKLRPEHDLVFCIRFLLHFKDKERKKIYAQASCALRPGGYFVFEAMNKNIVLPLRKIMGMKRYIVYDKLYSRQELVAEIEQNGFKVVRLYPVLNHFWLQVLLSRPLKLLGLKRAAVAVIKALEQFPSSEPYQWLVLCQKR